MTIVSLYRTVLSGVLFGIYFHLVISGLLYHHHEVPGSSGYSMVEAGIAGVNPTAIDLKQVEKDCPVCSQINLFHYHLGESDSLHAMQNHRILQWLEVIDIPEAPVFMFSNKGPPKFFLG